MEGQWNKWNHFYASDTLTWFINSIGIMIIWPLPAHDGKIPSKSLTLPTSPGVPGVSTAHSHWIRLCKDGASARNVALSGRVRACTWASGQVVVPPPPEANRTEYNRKILSCLGSSSGWPEAKNRKRFKAEASTHTRTRTHTFSPV